MTAPADTLLAADDRAGPEAAHVDHASFLFRPIAGRYEARGSLDAPVRTLA